MKASEILRKLADVIDSQEAGGEISNSQQAIQAVAPQEVPNRDQTPDLVIVKVDNEEDADKHTMAAPLQQELEIMKKAAGIPSAFDGHDTDPQ